MDTTICAKLHHLAAHLRAGAPPREVAAVLDDLAARNLVALPVIDEHRDDDLRHWRRLDEPQLRDENIRDAWNLAAGLHEDRRRDDVVTDTIAAVTAHQFGSPT